MHYEDAKRYREDRKAKAHRMADGDPSRKVDSSDWTPSEPMNMDKQTGPRPVTKIARKHGGKVEGEHAKVRADRKPRKSGGMTANEYQNRNFDDANEEREDGRSHKGGYATGGNVGDTVPTSRLAFQGGESKLAHAAGLKTGGRTGRNIGGSLEMLSPALMIANAIRGKKSSDPGSAQVVGQKRGGEVIDVDNRPARARGGKAGKTTVNIVIGAKGPQDDPMTQAAAAPPMLPPRPVPVAPPQAAMPPQTMPGGPAPMGGMPLPRKDGGRAKYPDMDFGSGSGEGRLEKIREYGKNAR